MVDRRRLLLVKRYWRRATVWVLILVAANWVTPGVEPFVPLVLTVLGITAFELGRRWLTRRNMSRAPQQAR
jgi:Sec-independent protein secretion pathway component TatC